MNANEILILNLEEVRRRSIKIWSGIPDDKLHWKTGAEAMSCIEMARHVLESDWFYMQVLLKGGSPESKESPFDSRAFVDIDSEIEFAAQYRKEFLALVGTYAPEDLMTKKVDRSDVGYVRTYGDFILRIAYHEAVHAGQLLSYLRTMNVPRPNVWD